MPHKLELYRRAVQHPIAEVDFLQRAYRLYRGRWPTLLREDFAGTCAVAAAWVALHDDNRALAVERHGPTARWAQRHMGRDLGPRRDDLVVVESEVHEIDKPRVDVVAALNFSICVFHQRDALRRYFRHARRCLRPGGILVIDIYGGPGATETKTQTRKVEGINYQWEQRSFDPVSHRVDCRMHFKLRGRKLRRNAFRYDWRLWTLPELIEVMHAARFKRAEVWAEAAPGRFRAVTAMAPTHEWLAYVIATC